MAHHTAKGSYQDLVKRLNKFPQGVAPTDLLYKILQVLFSEEEAGYVSLLPLKPFDASTAARVWKKSEAESKPILDSLCARGILLDIEWRGKIRYALPPPVAGFFEFSLMRVRKDIDQKVLAELYYQYMDVEENFSKELFGKGATQFGRIFPNEKALSEGTTLHVLDYEKATEVIQTARGISVGLCYCRHKKQHEGAACEAPMDICMSFNTAARALIKHKLAREVDTSEAMDLLQKAYDLNLVQFGENVRKGVSFICHCCGCCCEALLAARRVGFLHPVHTSNYIPELDTEKCKGCGKCVSVCPTDALTLVSARDPNKKNRKKAHFVSENCLGCGVCTRVCKEKGLALREREQKVIVPLNSLHRTVVMAVERGKLQNLIFDNQALLSHRLMAGILGAILKLPPIKQVMASQQMKSRYLEYLCSRK